jgi:hypothetical protein
MSDISANVSDTLWQRRIGGDDTDQDPKPPFRLLHRPPQFPDGKTATAITTMKDINIMVEWYFNQSRASEIQTRAKSSKIKRVLHFIFVNNNLIEGDQWRDRLIRRGVQNLKIFSSKSDVSNADKLNTLITQGEYINGKYVQVDFVLMCSNAVRFCNFTGESDGDSLLRRLAEFNPDIGVMCWFDEIDKFVRLLIDHIPKFQSFRNVINLNGITATPFSRFWKIMHDCGYYDVELIGQLPDPKNYMTFAQHECIYTDDYTIRKPAENFEFFLGNSGLPLKYKDDSDNVIVKEIPDLMTPNKHIIFVPGEISCNSHMHIANIAIKQGINALVINGKTKAFYRAFDLARFEINDYKKEQIKRQEREKQEGKHIEEHDLFCNMTSMDVAVKMYNDTSLRLKETNLAITGFYCVERGVTFNRPDFQFNYAIFTPYHYKEGSKEIESIIQLAGRTHGSKDFVRRITVLAPRYIIDTVNIEINNMIEFLRSAPPSINHACIFRETNGIPIMCELSGDIVEELMRLGNVNTLEKRNNGGRILREGFEAGKVKVSDKNKILPGYMPFNFKDYDFKGKRIADNEKTLKNYRFTNYFENFKKQKIYGQSVARGQYTIDITKIPVNINDDITLEPGTAFISFAYNPQMDEEESIEEEIHENIVYEHAAAY